MDKDQRRFFTPAQRRALFWAANGRCEECGIELNPNDWHADHSIPHHLGGITDVINGRALCPTCNLKKGGIMVSGFAQLYLNPWPDNPPLRDWQKRFLDTWKLLSDPNAGGQKDFLLAVVPAAGKTKASLKIAHEGLRLGWFDRIVVVVPSVNLVSQWIQSADENGINLQRVEDYGRGITTPKDSGGIVTTYQTVARDPERFRTYSSRAKTFVIGDEIHHCGERENLSWGEGMRRAFDHESTIRLVSSGTPFRTDNSTIPFVYYQDKMITRDDGVQEIQRVARADFEYSYGEALRDGVVRDIFFPTWDSKVSWRRAGQNYTHTFQDDLEPQLASDRMKAALDPRGEWLSEVIKNAHARLMTIRSEEGHPDAGGLIICKDKQHAEEVAKLVRSITRTEPVVVYSDIEDASGLITSFGKSDVPWIVTVRMVSEGVDIKRLRVGIYATNYKTRLFFLQAIARTTRYDSRVKGIAGDGEPVGQPAWFFVPDDPDLQAYMSDLMTISVHHIAEGLDNDRVEVNPSGQMTFLEGYEFIDGREAIETGHFYDERKWSPEEMDRARAIFDTIPAFDHVPDAAKALAVEKFLSQYTPPDTRKVPEKETAPSTAKETRPPAYQDERDVLKKACSTMTRRLTYMLMQINQLPKDNFGRQILDFKKAIPIVTAKLNTRFGARNIGDSSNDELIARRELLANWINDIVKGKWDPSNLS